MSNNVISLDCMLGQAREDSGSAGESMTQMSDSSLNGTAVTSIDLSSWRSPTESWVGELDSLLFDHLEEQSMSNTSGLESSVFLQFVPRGSMFFARALVVLIVPLIVIFCAASLWLLVDAIDSWVHGS